MNKKIFTTSLLVIALSSTLITSNSQASDKQLSDLDHAFTEAAEANGVPVKLLRALCWVESSHKSSARVISDGKGGRTSYGVCQIQYTTAKHFGYKGDAKQLMNTHTNTYYAAKALKHWMNKANGKWRLAVSAYNRGHYSKDMRIRYVCLIAIAMQENR